MSLGDALRRLIDPLDPAVAAWLRRELPRLAADGVIEAAQADAIANRYGVRLDGAVAGPPPVEAPPAAPAEQPPAEQPPAEHPPAGTPPAARASSPFFAEHAVTIVLYLGAFLVVSAVAIFLAYSWGDITGGARLAALTLLTAGFLGAAALCLPRPAVRPAGQTFLAIGAILVPANVAGTYLVYFEDSPLPGAVFWLLGATISGGFHAALSWRLRSRAYGVLAMISVPIGAGALAYLIEPDEAVVGPAAAVALILALAAARRQPPTPLVQAARALGSLMLPLGFLVTLPSAGDDGWERYVPPATLVLVTAGLAWEATRRGKTWWIGAASALALAPIVALALALARDRAPYAAAAVACCWIATLVARRLETRQALAWDLAAILPALAYPVAAWADDPACLALFASLALLAGFLAWAWRSPVPLYAGVLAVDGAYVKLLAIYGAPDSPAWRLGAALWPLAGLWSVAGAVLPRRLGGPAWVGAALTFLAAGLLTVEQARWNVGIAASAALASIVAAWRLGIGPILLLAAPCLLVAGYRGGEEAGLPLPWRHVAAGLTAWLLFGSALLPTPRTIFDGGPPPAAPAGPPGRAARALGLGWATWGRLAALAVAGFAALIVLALLESRNRSWLSVSAAWGSLTLLMAVWAWLARSRVLALGAALAGAPVLASAIAHVEPADGQAYAIPLGLYLLGVAWVERRLRRGRERWPGDAVAAAGLLILLGTGVVQSLDADRFGHALWTFAEGLALVGVGIAVRWRALVVGGVAGTVLVALRQLFDAVAALPGWAILGGSGLLLLGLAVALLLMRARLAAAGRAAAERWSNWD